MLSRVFGKLCLVGYHESWRLETYGPKSRGVTGSEGGGGRLIKVGVGIAAADHLVVM